MNMWKLLAWLAIAFVAIVGGCALRMFKNASDGLHTYRTAMQDAHSAARVTLYEGLPNESWEGELLKEELAKGRHLELDGFAFYREPSILEGREAAEITRLFEECAIPFRGPKACGAFHPDFMAEWTIEGETVRAHACFSCHEIMLVRDGVKEMVDIADGDFEAFRRALQDHQGKRPYSPVDGVNELWQDFHLAEKVTLHLGAKHAPEGSDVVAMEDGDARAREGVELSAADKARVSAALIRKGSIREYTAKKCKFSADYVLSWYSGQVFRTLLICRTCQELKRVSTRYDISAEVMSEIVRILKPYDEKLRR